MGSAVWNAKRATQTAGYPSLLSRRRVAQGLFRLPGALSSLSGLAPPGIWWLRTFLPAGVKSPSWT